MVEHAVSMSTIVVDVGLIWISGIKDIIMDWPDSWSEIISGGMDNVGVFGLPRGFFTGMTSSPSI